MSHPVQRRWLLIAAAIAALEEGLLRGGVMAVATLRRKPDGAPLTSEEYAGRPPVRRMVGAGKIVAHRRNPDGTYNILLSGLLRVRIETGEAAVHAACFGIDRFVCVNALWRST